MKRGAAAAGFASPGLNGLYALLPRKFVLPALWGAVLALLSGLLLFLLRKKIFKRFGYAA